MRKALQKKTLLLTLMAFTLMIFPTASFAHSSIQNDCNCGDLKDGNDPSEVLQGNEKLGYLAVLEESNLFKEKISSSEIAKDTSQVIHMVASDDTNKELEVNEFILVTGTIENDAENAFYGLIDIETNEVKRVIHLDVQKDEGKLLIKDYNTDGTLVNSQEATFDELQSGDFNIMSASTDFQSADNQAVAAADAPEDEWWYSWACNFSGIVACSAGCVAFIPVGLYGICISACSYVFGSSVC